MCVQGGVCIREPTLTVGLCYFRLDIYTRDMDHVCTRSIISNAVPLVCLCQWVWVFTSAVADSHV